MTCISFLYIPKQTIPNHSKTEEKKHGRFKRNNSCNRTNSHCLESPGQNLGGLHMNKKLTVLPIFLLVVSLLTVPLASATVIFSKTSQVLNMDGPETSYAVSVNSTSAIHLQGTLNVTGLLPQISDTHRVSIQLNGGSGNYATFAFFTDTLWFQLYQDGVEVQTYSSEATFVGNETFKVDVISSGNVTFTVNGSIVDQTTISAFAIPISSFAVSSVGVSGNILSLACYTSENDENFIALYALIPVIGLVMVVGAVLRKK